MADVARAEDAALVAEVLRGNREAFGQLVARYQSGVCGLAFSACGNVSQSEDLAQETFIVAWRKLGELEEPGKFKSWLYGIARNLINNTFRKQARNPLAASEPLDEGLSAPAAGNPTAHAISREEEAILWRSLAQIPETYREPLVLFYREHHSIERVAEILDLTEEAARQRLSRGRKLLQERVAAFVEGALEQTAPGQAFTLGVLAALPGMSFSTKAATFGFAAKGAGALGVAGKFVGPLIPFLGMLATYRQMKKAGMPETALRPLRRFYILIAISVGLMIGLVGVVMSHGPALVKASPVLFVAVSGGIILGYFAAIALLGGRLMRRVRDGMPQELREGIAGAAQKHNYTWEYRSRIQFLGLPLIHIRRGWRMCEGWPANSGWSANSAWPPPIKAWIAITDGMAIGGLFAYGSVAIAPVSMGAAAIGLLSYGGMVVGGITWGGFSFGVWAFGAITFGWEAFSGGTAIAWNLAWGYEYAIAHNYALGAGTVSAAEANTDFVRDMVHATWGHDVALALAPWFFWLMWLWTVPLFLSMLAGWFNFGKRKKTLATTNQ